MGCYYCGSSAAAQGGRRTCERARGAACLAPGAIAAPTARATVGGRNEGESRRANSQGTHVLPTMRISYLLLVFIMHTYKFICIRMSCGNCAQFHIYIHMHDMCLSCILIYLMVPRIAFVFPSRIVQTSTLGIIATAPLDHFAPAIVRPSSASYSQPGKKFARDLASDKHTGLVFATPSVFFNPALAVASPLRAAAVRSPTQFTEVTQHVQTS